MNLLEVENPGDVGKWIGIGAAVRLASVEILRSLAASLDPDHS
jgi:hypothetical protein